MQVETVATKPIDGQLPGTSGLRKQTRVFMQPGYVENFLQSIFNAIGGAKGKCFVVGGDGRYFNKQAIQIILKIAAANGASKIIVGRDGLLSTPAASHLIRFYKTDGGLILSASHNPGGIDEDFGLKFNIPNGGPAPEKVTAAMFEETKRISEYSIAKVPDVDLSKIGMYSMGSMEIEIVDPVEKYAELMETLFDFPKICSYFASGFTMRFDAMHAVTGPYATAILEETLGAAKGTVVNGIPLEDFGKGHPDPNPVWAKPLVDLMMSPAAPDFGAGPKIGAALRAAELGSFAAIADAAEDDLRAALQAGGLRFAPSLVTWSRQARLLADGDETGFAALTDGLVAGREA